MLFYQILIKLHVLQAAGPPNSSIIQTPPKLNPNLMKSPCFRDELAGGYSGLPKPDPSSSSSFSSSFVFFLAQVKRGQISTRRVAPLHLSHLIAFTLK